MLLSPQTFPAHLGHAAETDKGVVAMDKLFAVPGGGARIVARLLGK